MCQNWSQRWRHNEVLQICICQDGRSTGRATHWSGPKHHQNYPGVRQPRFLALLIPEISFFPPKFMQGLLDLPCAGIRCLNSVGVRNNSLKWLEMPQMQATLQPKPTTAAEIYCSPCREPREFISASNVLFALQKLGEDNTTKVFEIHVKLF